MRIPRGELPWLVGAIVAGGVLGPALLMSGLSTMDAAPAALLLNVEGVLTALIAWLVFKENADRQVVLGMLAIVAGGALLAWQPGGAGISMGALLVVAACACWAVDNNLTRKVSANDALLIACLKYPAPFMLPNHSQSRSSVRAKPAIHLRSSSAIASSRECVSNKRRASSSTAKRPSVL